MVHTDPYETDTKLTRLAQLANEFSTEVDETGLPLSPRAKAIQAEFHVLWTERFPENA